MRLATPATMLALLLVACGPAPDDGPEPGLRAMQAWVRAVPPTASMTAGYLVIENGGPEDAVLSGVESTLFASVETHETVVTNGIARMRPRERLVIAAGERTRLEPGGLHLMLMRPAQPLPAEGPVPLTLVFEDGRRVEIEAEIRAQAPE